MGVQNDRTHWRGLALLLMLETLLDIVSRFLERLILS